MSEKPELPTQFKGVVDEAWSSYDPKEIYTRHYDKQGHSAETRVHAERWFLGKIQELLNTGNYPHFRSTADVFVHFTYHGVYDMIANAGDYEGLDLMARARLIREIERAEEERKEYAQLVEASEFTLRELQREGNTEEMRKCLDRVGMMLDAYSGTRRENLEEMLERWNRVVTSDEARAGRHDG